MKKLILAFCLLLISAVIVGASSYAWFSMNGSVQAQGMQVDVTVPSSLTVSVTSESSDFMQSVTLVNASDMGSTIVPSAYALTPNVSSERDFFVLSSAAMATVNENGVLGTIPGSSDNPATVADNDYYDLTTSDYYKDTMWLRYDGEDGVTIDLQVRVEWDNISVSEDIKNAFHVLFIDEDGAVLLDYDMSNAASDRDLHLSLDSGAATGTKVTVYGFVDGNDPQCKNTSITVDSTLNVSIKFSELVP